MADFIALLCVALLIGGAVFILIRNKKKGKSCMGCPYAGNCNKEQCEAEK